MNVDEQEKSRETRVDGFDVPVEPVVKRNRTAAGTTSGKQPFMEAQGPVSGAQNCEDSDEPAGRGGRPGRNILSHVATEQRRRDKINEGFNALRELIPHKDKMDKATFLQQAVDYIRQLQAVMHQLLSLGAVNSLPEDLQWAIRMLLPRRQDVTPPAPEAATKPADALCHIVPPTAYLPYMLQPQQLAVLTQHAQQAKQPAASEAAQVSHSAVAPAPSVDLSQLQALMQQQQQQQAAQQLQAQQQAARMWPDQTTLWQLAHLQQMMQGASQQVAQLPQCSMAGLSSETLNTLAQAQALQTMFGHAGHNPGNNAMQGQGQSSSAAPVAPSLVVSSGEGCGAATHHFCAGSLPLPAGAPKARKSSAKLRKHTSAAKIAKPEAVRPATQAPGRPDAMSMMQSL
ncbi:hypothetical protein ABBQ32_005155 [Trebouxia sp. C0010 RCD-2024]